MSDENPEIPLELADHSYDQNPTSRENSAGPQAGPSDSDVGDESGAYSSGEDMSIVESTEDSDEYNFVSDDIQYVPFFRDESSAEINRFHNVRRLFLNWNTGHWNTGHILEPESEAIVDEVQEEPEQENENRESFDIDLPAEHSYFGPTERVSGVKFFEPNKIYHIQICTHHTLVYPGEIYPMIMEDHSFQRLEDTSDGLFFGLVFPHFFKEKSNQMYGVTCQIYEKGSSSRGNITIKSKACQRFQVCARRDDLVLYVLEGRTYADVKILPEIVLRDPLFSYSSLSFDRLQCNKSLYSKLRYYKANMSIWPKFIYDQYDIVAVMEKVTKYLKTLKLDIGMPTDTVLLSFWLARHVPLQRADQITIFKLNCATQRILHIGKTMNYNCFICCGRCGQRISSYNNVFAMSKHGVNTSYCNTTGYVHQTMTVYTILQNSLHIDENASTEFSWFPGYAWQIANCYVCQAHIGWRFSLPKGGNLTPKVFYGLSGRSINIKAEQAALREEDETT